MMQQGVCPRCKSENLEYSNGEIQDNQMYSYDVKCKDCGFEGEEWYKMEFEMFLNEDNEEIYEQHGWFKCWKCGEVYMINTPSYEVKGWHCPLCNSWTSGTGSKVDEKTKAILTLPPIECSD